MICRSSALVEGGHGVRFTVRHHGEDAPAFAIRYSSTVHAYVNRCAHRSLTLDWDPGRFFDRSRRYLICAVHGAHYEPASGACVAGPCNRGLVKLLVVEKDNAVYLASFDASGSAHDQ